MMKYFDAVSAPATEVISNYEEKRYPVDGSNTMENSVASAPVKQVWDRLLPTPVHTSKTYEPWMRIARDTCDKNSKHFISCDNSYSNDISRKHRSSSPLRKFHSRPHRKDGIGVLSTWTDNDGRQDCNRSNCSNTCTMNRYCFCKKEREGDAFLCPGQENTDFYQFHMKYPQFDPSGLQEQYLREVADLRSKIRELRGRGDGKRLHRCSDSDPIAVSYSDGMKQESKRARDNSPSRNHLFVSSSSAPYSNASFDIQLDKQSTHSFQDAKLPCAPLKIKTAVTLKKEMPLVSSYSPDSGFTDVEESVRSGTGKDSEDDLSASSSNTLSSDSNTTSVVGECLGAISISDASTNEIVPSKMDEPLKDNKQLPTCFRASLFSHVSPFINFTLAGSDSEPWPLDVRKHLKWKHSPITPLIVRQILSSTGFKLVKKSSEWGGTWGKHMKCVNFKTIKDFQKINHFPGTFQIGRKDRLWRNLHRFIMKFGEAEFGFIPHTYVLPQDLKQLRQAWERGHGKWIIKPPASARGAGIKVINRWAQLPKKNPLVVQKYLSDPYLINGNKFDLRLYVLVTSVNPLRIYLYDDGLVRFASVKYSCDAATLGDSYMHLTNYSINKLSSHYTHNEDTSACRGHKWTVKSLWKFLKKRGVDVSSLWTSLVDMVIKTIISGESSIGSMTRMNLTSRYCSYELFGFDVLLDRALKPWLLEVNISPSLHSASPLDKAVKEPMVRDLFNIAGYHVPSKVDSCRQDELLNEFGLLDRVSSLCYDKRLYTTALSKEERRKHYLLQSSPRCEYLEEILQSLTPDDVRHLIQSEDELTQAGGFLRVFPTPDTYMYHEYFEGPRYYNMLFDAWETKYWKHRREGIQLLEMMCRRKIHLTIPNLASSPKLSVSQPAMVTIQQNSDDWEDEKEVKLPERKVHSQSSIALYRAAKPRSGKASVVIKPFLRSQFIRKKIKLPPANPTCDKDQDQ